MMVGLAVLALTGGLLIAVSRLIPEQPDQSSRATATPVQSAEAGSPSPLPTPSPGPIRTMTVDPAAGPGVAQSSSLVSEWVRMRTAVTLLGSPSSISHPNARLHRGDAVYVHEVPAEEGGVDGWLMVDGPISGWIFGDIANAAMFERFPYRWRSSSAIYGLASDPAGFAAFGWRATPAEEVMLTSSDGTRWLPSDVPSVAWGRTAANGPAGWLMAGAVEASGGTTTTTLWQSADARSWERLGALPRELTDGLISMAGSHAGYVLLTNTPTATAATFTAVWFSADGLLWTERPMPELRAGMGIRLAATPLGFFIWSLNDPTGEGDGAFSADGWTWSQADPIGPGQIVDVAADSDHLLAAGRGPGGTRMWKGSIEGQRLVWASDNTAPFRGAVLGRMASDDKRVIVLGWDRATEAPLWWQRDGLSWQRHGMPASFGGLPTEVVGGPQGIVTIGQLASKDGQTPVFWHLGDGAIWDREPFPVMPAPAPPTHRTCGPVPHDLLGLLNRDGVSAATCFGDAPITVRGWSASCAGCSSRYEGTWDAEWLAQPTDERLIHLAPIESADWGALDGVLHPSVRGKPPRSRWLEVTGHFDDPEAASCHWAPTLADESWYSGTYDVVAGCRARFVVTALRAVRGP
ncbi:MAG TPA: hypothetical protein VIH33_03715 [Candidatus Limnocylindria bacterium]